MPSLVSPNDTWTLLAILLAASAFGLWAERTDIGARLSGAVIAIGTTFILSNLGVIPVTAPMYDMVWSYLVPLAIPLLLFKADLRRIVREAGPTLVAFACGAVGTTIGTLVAFRLVPLPGEAWQMAGIFAATFIGGSMNYAGAAEALQLRSPDLLTAGVAADNLVMTLFFLILFALPSIPALRRLFPSRHADGPRTTDSPSVAESGGAISIGSMATALALAAGTCAVGYGLASGLALEGAGILLVTLLAVLLATLAADRVGQIGGATEMGTLLMQVFFATIGAGANIAVVLETGPNLFIFAAVILMIHLTVLLGAGYVLRLDLAELVIASNANAGGPTTAAAMAASRGWDGLVIPAVLCGTLGYATATFLGVGIGRWLQMW